MRRFGRGVATCKKGGCLDENVWRESAAEDAALAQRTLPQCSRFADFGVVVHGAHEQKRPQIFLENDKAI